MKGYEVEYQSGESFLSPGKEVEYMLAVIEMNGREAELYAEEPLSSDNKYGTYLKLKAEITAQARDYGISEGQLKFKRFNQ